MPNNVVLPTSDNHVSHFPHRYCSGTLVEGTENQPVFLVCFNAEDQQPNVSLFFSKGIMMLISVFFLAATLYIYFIIPDLRETQDKVTSIAVACLMVFMILLSMVQLQASLTFHPVLCMTMGKSSCMQQKCHFPHLPTCRHRLRRG